MKDICLHAFQSDFCQKSNCPLKQENPKDVFTCQIERRMDAVTQTGGQALTVGFHTSHGTFQQDCHKQHKVQQCQL